MISGAGGGAGYCELRSRSQKNPVLVLELYSEWGGHKRTRPREESMCRGKMGRGGERAEQNREIERVRSESSFLRVPGEHTLVGLWKYTTHALIAWPY